MPHLARIVDANANRAREATRVLEDVARFALADAGLATEAKTLRHDLTAALSVLPSGWLGASRDTPADVGTDVRTAAETERAGLPGVATAAGKRLGEALRVIEEMLKTIDPDAAGVVEGLRYRAYELERGVLTRLGGGVARQWSVCVLLTEALCRRPWIDVLAAAIEGGADCIQVREKDMPGGDLARRVRQVVEAARPHGVAVIVNDRVDVALVAEADGVHVGREDLSVADVRRLAGRTLLVGASTHDQAEAAAAVEAGADYCGVGAMFASALKPDRAPAGPAYLRTFVERWPDVPHLAIGGITPDNVDALVTAGCRGVAVSTAVCAAEDPATVVRDLRGKLKPQASSLKTPTERPALPPPGSPAAPLRTAGR